MKTIVRDLARVILVVAVTIESGLAQEAAPEKHAKDIRAEQTQDVISASALCQRVRADGHSYIHRREVNPATLQSNLSTLMQKSDEVVLVSNFRDQPRALSPSGEEVVEYFDAKVLSTWKGSHKVGDLLTFAMPFGAVHCELGPIQAGPSDSTAFTMTGGFDWETIRYSGPYVLFLRQSQGDETELLPGLRLTGGEGMQGLFVLHSSDKYNEDCNGDANRVERCKSTVYASQEPVSIRYRRDPLKKKYEGMPASAFLKEVQRVADSQGYAGQTGSAK
jgi:hypothetical protein